MKSFFVKYKTKIISLLIGIFIGTSAILFSSNKNPDFELVKNLDVFSSLIKELNLYYVDEIDPGETIKKGMDGMLKALDPYTVYIPESKIEDFKFMTTGQYGGIGALIRKSDDYITISDPYEGFPADKAGIKAGDVLIEVDGKEIKGKTTSEVSELLKGQPGTEVKLKLKRAVSEKIETLSFNREKVQINPVPYHGMLDENTGYVRLTSFTNKAYSELYSAIKDLKEEQGAKSLILDLRNNPGGLLIESVKICNMFIPQNETVVSTKGKVEQWNKIYKANMPAYDTEIPLTILVNSHSASASEIVSGCMQDMDRAVIIGKRTFGKGLVQTTRELSYNAKLKVTTAKYYIPSGRCIQALDYSHRNEDGSVGKVPDSLITKFYTKNGRTVFDGGGVVPDIETENITLSKISTHLYVENMIFDFASIYVYNHPEAPEQKGFSISDKDYNEFIQFLSDKSFDYETNSEEELDDLIDEAKEEKYYENAKDEFESLRVKIAHDQDKDLKLFEDEIKDLISEEIIGRYYYQNGKLKYSLESDPYIKEALKVLNDSSMYQSILSGLK